MLATLLLRLGRGAAREVERPRRGCPPGASAGPRLWPPCAARALSRAACAAARSSCCWCMRCWCSCHRRSSPIGAKLLAVGKGWGPACAAAALLLAPRRPCCCHCCSQLLLLPPGAPCGRLLLASGLPCWPSLLPAPMAPGGLLLLAPAPTGGSGSPVVSAVAPPVAVSAGPAGGAGCSRLSMRCCMRGASTPWCRCPPLRLSRPCRGAAAAGACGAPVAAAAVAGAGGGAAATVGPWVAGAAAAAAAAAAGAGAGGGGGGGAGAAAAASPPPGRPHTAVPGSWVPGRVPQSSRCHGPGPHSALYASGSNCRWLTLIWATWQPRGSRTRRTRVLLARAATMMNAPACTTCG
jgi:hypothetical protein